MRRGIEGTPHGAEGTPHGAEGMRRGTEGTHRGAGDMPSGVVAGTPAAMLVRLAKLANVVPEALARPLFAGFGLFLGRIWWPERARLRERLDRIYHRVNRRPPRPFEQILDAMFIHFSLNALEMLRLPGFTAAESAQRFYFSGLEHVRAGLAAGKGVILVVPHLGNWELLGTAIVHAGFPLHSFYLAQKDDGIGSFLDYLRGFSGIVLHDRDRGASGGLRALRANEVLGMIADQDGGNQGVYLDFLGHWVSMPAGPANWSLKTGAALVPLHGLRDGKTRRYRAVFEPALGTEDGNTHAEKVMNRCRRLVTWMEELILSHPEQYLWLYDRFRPRHEKFLGLRLQQGMRRCHGECSYPL